MIYDQEHLTALRERDPQAVSDLFERYADKVYRLALHLLHDEQQSDGVVQNTFVTVIEKIDSFEGRSHISTWLYRIAYNECMRRLRNIKPDTSIDTLLDSDFMPANFTNWDTIPDAIMQGKQVRQDMERAIQQLPTPLQDVFTLRDVEELSTRETAEVLGLSESAVKVRLHRARLMLREILATYFEEYASQ